MAIRDFFGPHQLATTLAPSPGRMRRRTPWRRRTRSGRRAGRSARGSSRPSPRPSPCSTATTPGTSSSAPSSPRAPSSSSRKEGGDAHTHTQNIGCPLNAPSVGSRTHLLDVLRKGEVGRVFERRGREKVLCVALKSFRLCNRPDPAPLTCWSRAAHMPLTCGRLALAFGRVWPMFAPLAHSAQNFAHIGHACREFGHVLRDVGQFRRTLAAKFGKIWPNLADFAPLWARFGKIRAKMVFVEPFLRALEKQRCLAANIASTWCSSGKQRQHFGRFRLELGTLGQACASLRHVSGATSEG